MGHRWLIAALMLASSGCITTSAGEENGSKAFNLGWLIGGVAMAVDGDDRDDHTGWFEDEDQCDCHDR